MIGDYILIIGAMKSGTTTLFAQLAAHPAIAGAQPKEPGFFAFEEVHQLGWEWFEGLFDFEPTQHRYALEGSTDYTKAPFTDRTLERLEQAEAEGRRFKLIYIMRHPLERIESHARHVQRAQMEVGRNRSPLENHSFDRGISKVNLAISDYADQLAPYRAWWERGDLKLMTLESLHARPDETMADLGTFLDLRDLHLVQDLESQNKAGSHRQLSPAVEAARRAGPVAAIKKYVPASLKKRALENLKQKVEVRGRFTLTEEERTQLLPRYQEQVVRLRSEYQFDPGWSLA